jgi:hypothetical protein
MKAFIVAVYKEFEAKLVPESSFTQVEGLIGSPIGHKVLLRVIERKVC